MAVMFRFKMNEADYVNLTKVARLISISNGQVYSGGKEIIASAIQLIHRTR